MTDWSNSTFALHLFRMCLIAASRFLALAALAPSEVLSASPVYYSTGVGEHQTIRLEDGSSITLNTRSKISVFLTAQAREVRLLEGEAFLDVRHDVGRPFRVIGDGVLLEDAGTQFNVHADSGEISVLALEGYVRLYCDCVTAEDNTSQAGRRPNLLSVSEVLGPSDEARITHAGTIDVFHKHHLTQAQLEDTVAWRNGHIVLDNVPLTQAVREFNRYNRQQIVVADEAIATLTVAGRFDNPNIPNFLTTLSHTYGIRTVPEATSLTGIPIIRLVGKGHALGTPQ